MKQVITKMERVETTIYECDICNEKTDSIDQCSLCGKDLCRKHQAMLELSYMGYGTFNTYGNCCPECNEILKPWRIKMNAIDNEFEVKKSKLISEFKKAFPQKEE